MSLLCRAAGSRPLLNTLVAPCLRVAVVPVRCASTSSKQKKTQEKYAAKAAKSKKFKGDFLSKKMEDNKKKQAKQAVVAERPRKIKEGPTGLSVEEQTILDDDTNNILFDFPNLNYTKNRYDEFEKGEETEADKELVTEKQLKTEREQEIQRLWEPYQTENFNLKGLIGDASAVDETSPNLIQEARPSKMLYYTEEEIQKYLPEGVAGKLKEFNHFKFNKKGILVRPVIEDVISWLESWRQRDFVGRLHDKDFYTLLNGPAGAGKSCLLNPLVQWARMSGWLVIFVPDGKDWAGYPKKKEGLHKRLSYSKVNDTWFGQPSVATKWITALLQAHGDKLSTLPLRTNFTVRDVDPDKSKFIATPQKTLKDLLEYGLSQPDQASDCVWYLRKELCSVTEYPILIVVDAVNTMRSHSFYGDPIDPYIFAPNLDTSRLVLNRAFQDFRNHGLINGMYVGTVCYSTSRRSISTKMPNPDMKRQQYRIDSRIATTPVPPISRSEAHLLAGWYRENSVFTEDIPSQTVDYMWTMAEGNGDEFWRQATFM